MKKEDWLQRVHDRMADYEIDEPGGLWNAIESKLEATPSSRRSLKHPVGLWVKRSMVAAAMIAVVVSAGVYFINSRHDATGTGPLTVLPDTYARSAEYVPQKQENSNVNVLTKSVSENTVAQNRIPVSVSGEGPSVLPAETEQLPIAAEEPEKETAECAPVKTDDTSKESRGIEKEYIATMTDNSYIAPIRHEASTSNSVSVSVYGSGGPSSALNYNLKANPFVTGLGPDNSNWEDNPALGILLFNQGKDIETDIKHRIPIRAGISFAYNFNDRLGLESGLSYANLTSDVRKGSDSHYYTGEQKLHYIGIPLNLKYRVFSWKRLDLYASVGALAEKCVSAKLDKDFILGNQKKSSESENLSEKPLQWSVNASVGAQCNILKAMSVFVEPGISYYFNDGTSIQTIYKEQPLNFNLNMGLRFTFGK